MFQEANALAVDHDGSALPLTMPPAESLLVIRALLRTTLVDVVQLTGHLDMWIGDESLYEHPINQAATALAQHCGFSHQAYHGPVVLCSFDEEGETVGLDADQLVALAKRISEINGDLTQEEER